MIGKFNDCLDPVYVPIRRSYTDQEKLLPLYQRKKLFRPVTGYLRSRCGKCIYCRMKKTSEWSIRLVMESKYWKNITHATLTYDNDHVPQTDLLDTRLFIIDEYPLDQEFPDFQGTVTLNTLDPRDMQLFLKRVRKSGLGEWHSYRSYDKQTGALYCNFRKGFKYYGVGEYGSLRSRPHLHILFFGIECTEENRRKIQELWGKGTVYFKRFYEQTAGYVAGYVQKKLYQEKDTFQFKFPEFMRCSQRLGMDYIEDHIREFDDDHAYICWKGKNGKSFQYGIPRYFRRYLVERGILTKIEPEELMLDQKEEKRLLEDYLHSIGSNLSDFFRQRRRDAEHKEIKKLSSRRKTGEI